ncbi:3-hydroxyacyl-CoA dehydrogenase family protein [Streptomyces sp. SL13]|jgi:3-hydroxybutyryl-CoA dehydrogenase|uniref:3-hydroxyacyl-CoA dehydrogenase family protein n=1 Tax=Streptantibioticus silvisoli TaxID=2705255 RepID=A0AA90HEL3_9ACTN|nr:3-hydroxyacyl-CoA dehydrogenase family protein [Streptantibioticus silvisoli]MDI5966359.1 3-hydroxyacyl-CoA dehydrogenase family protein [Streptantibioticus silvisoli]MDI5974270.1 3-hydroxyacyl-CoA dehydrogenase family protein [Streptantibioticus silvisoli]
MTISPVAVIGAGTIGRGVAHSLAATGHDVILADIGQDVLDEALGHIRRELRFARFLGRPCGEDDDATLARITTTTELADVARAAFVVENTTEDWEIKREVYRRLDEICPPATVLAANTSCVPVTRIAGQVRAPERVIGMHFMNPVPHKPVVEMIRGVHTSEATIARARELLAGMDKTGILVNDSPGFVANRVLMLSINEAAYLVQERVAEPAEIDQIFKSCLGHKMGMLETADLIGIDTILKSIEMLHDSFSDSKYRPCPLLRRMVDAGRLGKKTNHGFYTYH